MGKVIGIDLGTTNSCVAVMEGGEPQVIPNSEGNRTTPSIVAITEDDERLVGLIAKRQAITNPENTVFSVKRLIGRKYHDAEVNEIASNCPFKIINAPNGDVRIKIRGTEFSPPEISAMVLSKLKLASSDFLGEDITEAVITVPAYFNDHQRQATKDAGRISGLDVLRIINEPTAASLAYGLDKEINQKIAVYDLGGGTFDISILEIGDGVFEVLSTNGDTFLGGDNFDEALINWLADEFEKENNINLRGDRRALQRLKEAAEKAKCELSLSAKTEINLPFITADETGPKHLNVSVSRAQFEILVDDLAKKTIEPCKVALDDAKLSVKDINSVILVGGQTRSPIVQRTVTSYFEKQPSKEVNPDEVVAIGAAIQGGVLTGDVKDIILLDVTPLSLGIETVGGVFTKLIERNTTIPTKVSQIFSTAEDNQTAVAIHILQGEREMAKDNKSLGKFELVGIPPAPRGVPQIEVTFEIDANGILNVKAGDLGTQKEQAIRITGSSGLTSDEIAEKISEAERYAENDRQKRVVAELENQIETLVYSTKKSLSEFSSRLSEYAREDIKDAITDAQDALKSKEPDELKNSLQNLRKSAQKLTEVIYSSTSTNVVSADDDDFDDDFGDL